MNSPPTEKRSLPTIPQLSTDLSHRRDFFFGADSLNGELINSSKEGGKERYLRFVEGRLMHGTLRT